MGLALYSPGEGYYERPQKIGVEGDFYTSVSAGPLFGELLAFQFARWFAESQETAGKQLQIIEAGAHDGKLAMDALRWFRTGLPEVFSKLEYWIVEPSELRRTWQSAGVCVFADFGSRPIRKHSRRAWYRALVMRLMRPPMSSMPNSAAIWAI